MKQQTIDKRIAEVKKIMFTSRKDLEKNCNVEMGGLWLHFIIHPGHIFIFSTNDIEKLKDAGYDTVWCTNTIDAGYHKYGFMIEVLLKKAKKKKQEPETTIVTFASMVQ